MPVEKDDVSITGIVAPPPSKKLKQARLPFKVLTPKPVVPQVSPQQKKRKWSDPNNSGPQKAAKTPKNDENCQKISTKKPKCDDAENEVSSSSEADLLKVTKSPGGPVKPKLVGMLDKFVRTTQQLEVTTSSIVDCDNEAEGKEVGICKPLENKEQSASKKLEVADDEAEATPDNSDIPCTPKETDESKTGSVDEEEPQQTPSSDSEEGLKPKTSSNEKPASKTSNEETESKSSCNEDADTSDSIKANESKNDNSEDKENDDKSEELDVSMDTSSVVDEEDLSTSVTEDAGSPQNKDEKSANPRVKKPPSAALQKRKEEKEKERLEKQRKRDETKNEKERQRKEEKERKEQERLEAKTKRDEERQKQADMRQREKDEKLKAKEEEKKKKDEERRKRQEVIDAKADEKRKKEEERMKAEEEQKAKKDKIKQRFSKFFTKTEGAPQSKQEESKGLFAAFEVKKEMRMAPRIRVPDEALAIRAQNLDEFLHEEKTPAKSYLDDLKKRNFIPGKSSKTWPKEVEVEIVPSTEGSSLQTMRAKFLKFHENHRPAYYGTWRRARGKVSPRDPLRKDGDLLDYEVDSADEWEEEEPGESLSDSEGEDSDGEKEPSPDADADNDEEEDGFFVPHGYLSEGEGCEEEDEEVSPERLKAKQLAKAKAWDREMSSGGKCEVLRPVCVGCCWAGDEADRRDPTWDILDQFAAIPLLTTPIPVTAAEKNEGSSPTHNTKKGLKQMSVPDEALPDLVRLVNGNIFSFNKISKEFQEYWRRKTLGLSLINTEDATQAENDQSQPSTQKPAANEEVPMSTDAEPVPEPAEGSDDAKVTISKRQLDAKIRAIAEYKKMEGFRKKCWYVHQEVLDKHGLKDLPVPTKWHWLTRSNIPVVKAVQKTEAPTPTATTKKPVNSTPNIKQFAVAGYTPPILSPAPASNKTPLQEKSSLAALFSTPQSLNNVNSAVTPKRERDSLTPSVLFSQNNPDTSSTATTPSQEGKAPATPKDRNQRTLMSMFSPPPATNPAQKVVTPKSTTKPVGRKAGIVETGAKSAKPEVIVIDESSKDGPAKLGDSVDAPMEID